MTSTSYSIAWRNVRFVGSSHQERAPYTPSLPESQSTIPAYSSGDLEILSSPELMRQIRESQNQMARGVPTTSAADLRHILGL
jgi:hypothetical protein